jgi:mercuric ion transport protein
MQDGRMAIKNERPSMRSHGLLTAGAVSVALAAICCATPLLVVALGAIGLAAWMVKADDVALALLLLGLVLVGFGLYRRRAGTRLHSGTP